MEENEKKDPEDRRDPIADALGITPLKPTIELKRSGRIVFPDPNDDYEYSRQNMKDLIEKGMQHFRDYGDICGSQQEARSYEVLSTMFDSLVEANEKLVNLRKTEFEIKAIEAKNDPDKVNGGVTNQNIFVGSTSDFQKMITNMQSKNNEDI